MLTICVAEVAVGLLAPENEFRDQIIIVNFHGSSFRCGGVAQSYIVKAAES
ncbi:hypothetical protein [Comamonas thiooxydans]|uniref:hypothetical protein n=1 Tax=Comamonas thiooxydans TaxID=363952 RepID=UPI0021154DE9|nr:hypothetical protein [Comamonas thiooxydans]UUE95031.1 hypothetical protein MJ608_05080 [Comamonas thiooxydans]